MGVMMLVWLVAIVVLGVVVSRAVTGRLPPAASTGDADRRLAEQAERIEQLEEELRQVREQADFTERLLTDRGRDAPADEPRDESRDDPRG